MGKESPPIVAARPSIGRPSGEISPSRLHAEMAIETSASIHTAHLMADGGWGIATFRFRPRPSRVLSNPAPHEG